MSASASSLSSGGVSHPYSTRLTAALRHPAVHTAAVLAVVAVVVLHGIGQGEFDPTNDEAAHATTGIFFRDFYREMPLGHAEQYAFRYYAQYPALGLIHWPPGFHVVEGAVYSVLGASVESARFTVALYALAGALFWYLLIRRLHGPGLAALSTIVIVPPPWPTTGAVPTQL